MPDTIKDVNDRRLKFCASGLAERDAARLLRLAESRGWEVVCGITRVNADVFVYSPSGDTPAVDAIEPPCAELAHAAHIALAADRLSQAPEGEAELRFALDPAADDASWITLIEAAGRAARLLRNQAAVINRLKLVSTTDALTGIHNRMHLMNTLGAEFKRFERSDEPLACIMIDIDHFKNINDTYGHDFGDKALIGMAQILAESMRETDILGRYGGEEFLCILPATDTAGAQALAEKLRLAVEAHRFNPGAFNLDLTASFGVASTSMAEFAEASQLLKWSDRALYRAKQTGRNRVCVPEHSLQHDPADLSHFSSGKGDEARKPVVLVAHSEPDKLGFLSVLERLDNFELVVVEGGRAAIELMNRQPPAIALIQADLPGISGWDLLVQLKDMRAESFIPIAFILSPEATLAHVNLERTGPDDAFSEMIFPADFKRRLRLYLRMKTLHDRFSEASERLTVSRARLVKAERLSALGEMASGVAHDFNNHLSAIIGRTERLLASCEHEENLRELHVIHQAASDGAETIRRIKKFSRSIANLDASEVMVFDVVEDCMELTRVRWKDHANRTGLKYEITNEVDHELCVMANCAELRDVFTNIMINSLDAMPEGGRIEIGSRAAGEPGAFIISIRDTGQGMGPEIVERVFEPFFSTKTEKGTGLGMSIIYGIVTRMGGEIKVKSEIGKGAVFEITLPSCEAAAPAEASPALIETASDAHEPAMAVLIVDDEVHVRELLVDVLRERGHEVTEAEGGDAAITLVADHRFDVVITDLSMPDRPGWDVAKAVKEQSPETYVVLSSGWGDDFTEEYLEAHGVDRWLPKPASLDDLFALLRPLRPIGAEERRATA